MKNHVHELEQKAYQYRKRFLEIFTKIGFGHVTSAFSWTEIATVLYNEVLDLPKGYIYQKDRDQVFVSKGHGIGILFPIFEDLNLLSKKEVEGLKIGGSNQDIRKLIFPGYDFYGGSLGNGLGMAAGMSKGMKMKGSKHRVFCIVGDAECYEGSIWEAINFAGHNRLENLTVIVDRNMLGCSDFTEHMLKMEPLKSRWEMFGWNVKCVDGHNIEDLYNVFMNDDFTDDRPTCIIASTKKGKGLDYLIDKPLMHGYMPSGYEIDRAFSELK